MSVLVRGSSRCPLCGEVIAPNDDVTFFPVFVPNELDPLWLFNDIAAHTKCVHQHPLGPLATNRLREYEEAMRSRTRRCVACGEVITNPDDYLMIFRVADDEHDPLYGLSFTELHKKHLSCWPDALRLLSELEQRRQSGSWAGRAIERMISTLRQELASAT